MGQRTITPSLAVTWLIYRCGVPKVPPRPNQQSTLYHKAELRVFVFLCRVLQTTLFDAAAMALRQDYARRSIEMIEVFTREKKKVAVSSPRSFRAMIVFLFFTSSSFAGDARFLFFIAVRC